MLSSQWRWREKTWNDNAVSVVEAPNNKNTELYSLEDITQFLDETFKKSVIGSDYFKDCDC